MLIDGAAALLLAGGLFVAAEGALAWWRKPSPRGNLAWMRVFRAVVFGSSLAMVGVGLWLGWPALVFFGLIVAIEETIETSICIWALKQEPLESAQGTMRGQK